MRQNGQVYYDPVLGTEGISFHGIMQPFPNHFHDHYVIGCIEAGGRRMTSGNREYTLIPGDLVLFGPGDTHACEALDGKRFTYHCLNLKPETVRRAYRAVSDAPCAPCFAGPHIRDKALSRTLASLALAVSSGQGTETDLFSFLESVLARYCAVPQEDGPGTHRTAVEAACAWMRLHSAGAVTLDGLGCAVGMNKFTLLRAFVKLKGITPYRYLETIRIGAARDLLEQGAEPVRAALQAGFADQSHFTRHFKRTTGLTPAQYRKIFPAAKNAEPA